LLFTRGTIFFMKILVVGGGGREHAIIWKLIQNKSITQVHCAPGNGGISDIAKCVPIGATDIDAIVAYAKTEVFDLVIVAPDDPLYMGLVDALEAEGIRAFGPSQKAAEIEGSKVYAKNLMTKYNIPTADCEVFDNYDKALAYVSSCKLPTVVKADGLALGKGVIICTNVDEAIAALNTIMVDKVFGDAGNRVIIEEFITGPEVSVLSFCDGETILPMASAQDHKRAFDNDTGPNTGGMGTFSPTPKYTAQVQKQIEDTIIKPTVSALKSEGRPFKGIIFFGLMLTEDGPKLLEYNARFGDPEAQVVLPRLKNDLLEIFNACIDGTLSDITLEWDDNSAVCVVMASGGYPVAYKKGELISGLNDISQSIVFHAGTKKRDGRYYTNGGRVLGVTALGDSIASARAKAYADVKKIEFTGAQFRADIGIK